MIVLKSGDVILGCIISEDKRKLVVEISMDQGRCRMNIEKSLIQSIVPTKPEKSKKK